MAGLKEYVVIFETHVDGQVARVEVPTDGRSLQSREVRKDCEAVARASFKKLSPRFTDRHKIKAIDIVELKKDGH